MIQAGIPDYEAVESLLDYSIRKLLIEPTIKARRDEGGPDFEANPKINAAGIGDELEALDIPLNITFTESCCFKSKEVADE